MMGSGTTGITSLRLNRKFIGIDSDKKQYDLALRNLSKTILILQLLQMSIPT